MRFLVRLGLLGAVSAAACLLTATAAVHAASNPTVTLSVDSGPPGTALTITGAGFPPGEIVALYIDSPSPFLTLPIQADPQGGFKATATWPGKSYDATGKVDPTKPGTHQVCGDTAYASSNQAVAAKACSPYLVPNPPPGPAPSNFPQLAVLSLVAFGVLILGGVVIVLRTRKT